MSQGLETAEAPPPVEFGRPDRVGVGVAVVGGVILAVLIAAGQALPVAGLLVLGLATLIGLRSWRLSVILALVYLPIEGIFWVALYPHTAPAALAKDFLFVIPAYIGFFYSYMKSKQNFVFPGFPLLPVVLLAGLVIVEIFNPLLSRLLVGLVGAKVWLFYIPMAFLGYQLIRSRSDLDRLLNIMCLVAIVPAVVGIAEAVLYYTGHSSFVYSLYGSAASAATQGFAAINVGGAGFRRVPSTFSFVAQYYIFMTSMVAFGYAWWRRAQDGSWTRRWRLAVWLLFLVAALTSGARGALAFVPLMLIAILLIDGRLGVSSIGPIAALGAGLALMIALVGASATGTLSDLFVNARIQIHSVFITGLREASHHLFLGSGTGSDTNAARYVSGSFSATGGWQESYLAKSILELGIVGLALIATIFGSILVRGLRIRRRLRDPGLIAMASAILGLMIWGVVYTVKAQYLVFDPLNLYFWLFTGILFKLAVLDREDAAPPEARPSLPPGQPVRVPQQA
jgi:O-antigen ligase